MLSLVLIQKFYFISFLFSHFYVGLLLKLLSYFTLHRICQLYIINLWKVTLIKVTSSISVSLFDYPHFIEVRTRNMENKYFYI